MNNLCAALFFARNELTALYTFTRHLMVRSVGYSKLSSLLPMGATQCANR